MTTEPNNKYSNTPGHNPGEKETGVSGQSKTDLSRYFFHFAPDAIMINSLSGDFLEVNPKALDLLGFSHEELTQKNLRELSAWIKEHDEDQFYKELIQQRELKIEDQLRTKSGKELSVESHIRIAEFRGERYIWTITRNISTYKEKDENQKMKLKDTEFIKNSARELIAFSSCNEIYKHLTKKLHSILPDAIILAFSYDRESQTIKTEDIKGIHPYENKINKLLRQSPFNLTYKAPEEYKDAMLANKLVEIPNSIFEISGGRVRKSIAHKIEKLFNIEKIFSMGIAKDENLFGKIMIILPKQVRIHKSEIIQALVSQASIAIQRTKLEKELHKQKGLLVKFHKVVYENLIYYLTNVKFYF